MKDGVRLAVTLYMPDGTEGWGEIPSSSGISAVSQR